MTPEEFEKQMREIADSSRGDPEAAHATADELMQKVLKELGYGAGADVFDDVYKWYA